MTIYLVMMAEGFLGYVLPYGQMSYWGAQVIISLFGAIPYIGESLEVWVRGDYYISGSTVSRFFALHVVALPLMLIALVFMHLVALHEVGAGNPEGIDIEEHLDEDGVPLDSVPFFPYKVLNALVGIGVFMTVFSIIMFFFQRLEDILLKKLILKKLIHLVLQNTLLLFGITLLTMQCLELSQINLEG